MPTIRDLEELKEAGLTREDMVAIRRDFVTKALSYEHTAQYITNLLLKTPGVHSVRYRVKSPLHLYRKIVRKKLENKDRVLTLATYEEEITDLAGIRILHLFKSDWRRIHKFITNTWTLKEKPIAYHRQGDSPAFLKMFEDCDIKEHPFGYRSVHYIIETSPTKAKRYIELQVRTIFEEGWSEIDHKVRYPSFSDNPLTNNLLMILNRLAGSADEMSSFVQELSIHLEESQYQLEQLESEKDEQIRKLEDIIKNSDISGKDKTALESIAKTLTVSSRFPHLETSGIAEALAILRTPMSTLLGNRPVDRFGNKTHDYLSDAMGMGPELTRIADQAQKTIDRLNKVSGDKTPGPNPSKQSDVAFGSKKKGIQTKSKQKPKLDASSESEKAG